MDIQFRGTEVRYSHVYSLDRIAVDCGECQKPLVKQLVQFASAGCQSAYSRTADLAEGKTIRLDPFIDNLALGIPWAFLISFAHL